MVKLLLKALEVPWLKDKKDVEDRLLELYMMQLKHWKRILSINLKKSIQDKILQTRTGIFLQGIL